MDCLSPATEGLGQHGREHPPVKGAGRSQPELWTHRGHDRLLQTQNGNSIVPHPALRDNQAWDVQVHRQLQNRETQTAWQNFLRHWEIPGHGRGDQNALRQGDKQGRKLFEGNVEAHHQKIEPSALSRPAWLLPIQQEWSEKGVPQAKEGGRGPFWHFYRWEKIGGTAVDSEILWHVDGRVISKEERGEWTSQTKSIVQLVAKRLFGCRWVRSLPSMSPLHMQLALRQEGSQHHRPGGTSLQTCFKITQTFCRFLLLPKTEGQGTLEGGNRLSDLPDADSNFQRIGDHWRLQREIILTWNQPLQTLRSFHANEADQGPEGVFLDAGSKRRRGRLLHHPSHLGNLSLPTEKSENHRLQKAALHPTHESNRPFALARKGDNWGEVQTCKHRQKHGNSPLHEELICLPNLLTR